MVHVRDCCKPLHCRRHLTLVMLTVLLVNRALCHKKREAWGLARLDSEAALISTSDLRLNDSQLMKVHSDRASSHWLPPARPCSAILQLPCLPHAADISTCSTASTRHRHTMDTPRSSCNANSSDHTGVAVVHAIHDAACCFVVHAQPGIQLNSYTHDCMPCRHLTVLLAALLCRSTARHATAKCICNCLLCRPIMCWALP